MVIVVDGTGVRVDGPEDLRRFHVEAPTGFDVGAALEAAGFGRMDDGAADAWVAVAAVRSAVAGGSTTAGRRSSTGCWATRGRRADSTRPAP